MESIQITALLRFEVTCLGSRKSTPGITYWKAHKLLNNNNDNNNKRMQQINTAGV